MTPKQTLKARLINEFNNVNVEKLVQNYTEKLAKEVQTIADAVLGIDRSWSRLEIKSGLINKLIDESLETYLKETFQTMFEAEIRRQVKPVKVKNSIRRAIQYRVDNRIRDLTNCFSLPKQLENYINSQVDALFDEVLKELEDEPQTNTQQNATPPEASVLRYSSTQT